MNRWSSFLVTALAASGAGCSEPSSSTPAAGSGAGGGGSSSQAGSSGKSTAGGASGSGGQAGSMSNAAAAGQTNAGGSSGGGAGGEPAAALLVSPGELVFGAVQQTQASPQTISLENTGSVALQLESIQLDPAAAGTGSFELLTPPPAGVELLGGAKQELQIRFNPTSEALFESRVVIQTNSPILDSSVPLFGLGTQGLEGENEPYLKIVLTTLGFDVDVGGAGLLSTSTPLVGSEVAAQRFEAAAAGPIELVPVARYSPEEPIPYGYNSASDEVEVGVISSDQYQALNPGTDAGSETTFADPGAPFGLFTISETHSTYTEDAKNAGNAVQHAVRTYPLKDRAGSAIPNAYLVCFEEAANGDYQDYVFTISNVKPAAP